MNFLCSCGEEISEARWDLGLQYCKTCGQSKAQAETQRKSRAVAETHKGGFVYLGTDEGAAKQYAADIANMRSGTGGRTGGERAFVAPGQKTNVTHELLVASTTKGFLLAFGRSVLARADERNFTRREAENEFCRTAFWASLLTARLLGNSDLANQLDHYHRLVVKHGRVGITLLIRDLT